MVIVIWLVLVIALVILFWQASLLVAAIFGSPTVKTERKIIIEALKLARVQKGEIFYDLGCGNGDTLIEATKFGARATGFEISPFYFLWARARTFRYSNIQIKFKNIFDVDLSRADIIYCYLLPELLKKLNSKFARELKPGSYIISIGFPIKFAPKYKKFNIINHTVYIYQS